MADQIIPTGAVWAAGALILASLVGVGIQQWDKRDAPPLASSATPVNVRTLHFIDQGDQPIAFKGRVRVIDEQTGQELPELAASDGFIRAVLNGLAFERSKRRIEAPGIFRLVHWSDHRLTLEDPATGARISLDEFGSGNLTPFLRFLRTEGNAAS
ncbi:photosynthetic complex assembly protein PuhC [Zavarzinia sp. CC-PAN008]|uniref:photosynthetic complex assembly protein PuhC n=1 Tax=Zavarzinia sp. CC-PAN008 TaxID=3243332 RepID=UPI003F74504A